MVLKSIEVLDTTLRDGSQMYSVSFTINDKVRITLLLDELGVDYIEGGWPGSNPKDEEFFKEMKKYSLSRAKLAAFGSTRRGDTPVDKDANMDMIIKSEVDVAVIFGKSWVLHVDKVLRVSREKNLEMIYDSIRYLKEHGFKVIYDAEHFYQGFKEDHEYALKTIRTAEEAGADVIVLADTNGGTPPLEVYRATEEAVKILRTKVGVHMHNDIGCAVANTLVGVNAGARHIQGTINGIGERTGNADLVQIIPTLILKMGFNALRGRDSLKLLRDISRRVYEILGRPSNPYQPYVGEYAFAHKAGVHADAVMKVPEAYEHIDPSLVGNERRIIISELSGSSNIVNHLEALGIRLDKRNEGVRKALQRIKELEKLGYSFDIAPASAVLIALKELGLYEELIVLNHWRVINDDDSAIAVVKVNSQIEAAEGIGPIHAMDNAIRRVLQRIYPELSSVELIDYRVILPGEIKNTESKVRVTVEFTDGKHSWRTMGVSSSIIEASIMALIDGFDYYLQVNKVLPRKLHGK